MKLVHKCALFALACSLLPLLLVGALAFHAVRHSLSEIIESDLQASAEQGLAAVQKTLDDSAGDLLGWSRLGIMQDVLTDDDSGDLQAELERLNARYPIFADLQVINDRGTVVAAIDPPTVGGDSRARPAFRAALAGSSYRGPLRHSPRLRGDVIELAEPIRASYDEASVLGALVGSLDWDSVRADLARRTLLGGAQDRRRFLILQSRIDGSTLYVSDHAPATTRAFVDLTKPRTEVIETTLGGAPRVIASAESAPTATTRDPQWLMSAVVDSEIAYASVYELRRYFIIVGALSGTLIALLGLLLARFAVRPLHSLAEAAGRLAGGDFDFLLPRPRNDEIGTLALSFATMRDAIRRNERELTRRTEISEETARLKGEFLANMSHEIRTPINGVLGMTELLLNTELDERQSRYATTILRSGKSLLGVINDILDFSKIEAGKLELQDSPFDLRELVEDVMDLLAESAHRKGLELIAQLRPDSHIAYRGDANRIRQVLINLLGNAIKFTPEGEVRLEVSCESRTSGPDRVVFAVSDTGIGIAPAARAAIFDSFVQADGSTTRRFGGTGLGLSISASLVELMQGSIEVESTPGEGSTFRFSAALERLPADVESDWSDSDALLGKRVLIVDDNRTNRSILEEQVGFWGAIPQAVPGGHEALEALRAAQRASHDFDLAILDMHMPGMDGLELASRIQRDPEIAPVRLCLLSSVCDRLDVKTYRSRGIESTLTKPARQPELFRCLTVLLRGRRTPGEPEDRACPAAEPPLHGHVLLAEDHPVNQYMMSEMLSLLGLTVTVRENGALAADYLEREHADVVLMDCQMPVLDGFAATRRIRRQQAALADPVRTPIIALTANALQGDRERCLQSGMDDYLAKPIERTDLRAMLARWLPGGGAIALDSAIVSGDAVVPGGTVVSGGVAEPVTPGPVSSQPDVAAVEGSPLDAGVLDTVLEMSAGAAPGFLAGLIVSYATSSAEDMACIARAFAERQADELGRRAHRMKSSSASLGALELASLCREIESAARSGDITSLAPVIERARLEHVRAGDALHALLPKAA